MNSEYNLPADIDLYGDELGQDFRHFPAIENVGKDVYIIKDNRILCTGNVGSSYMGEAIVYLDNEEAFEVFKHDLAFKVLGRWAPFPFFINTGWYVFGRFDEEDEERGVGLTVVDKLTFDFGIASKMRYSHIPGFGSAKSA